MPIVSARELKNQAIRIVRAVREEQVPYIVTVGGRPAAVVRTYTEADEAAHRAAGVDEYLTRLDQLGDAVTASWHAEISADQAVSEQRR